MPPTMPFDDGLPNWFVETNKEFAIVNHWSYQSALVGSFQLIVKFDKLFPFESSIGSVVEIFVSFKMPLAGTFLFIL